MKYRPSIQNCVLIMLTCPCNVDPLTPHFYIVKLGYQRELSGRTRIVQNMKEINPISTVFVFSYCLFYEKRLKWVPPVPLSSSSSGSNVTLNRFRVYSGIHFSYFSSKTLGVGTH